MAKWIIEDARLLDTSSQDIPARCSVRFHTFDVVLDHASIWTDLVHLGCITAGHFGKKDILTGRAY